MSRQLNKTPPESLHHIPFTPPPTTEKGDVLVLQIIEEIKRRKAGNLSISCWSEYILEQEDYQELLRRLQSDNSIRDFVEDKLRFILRMPTPLHELVIKYIVEELEQRLRSISWEDSPSAQFAKDIESEGSSTITFEDAEFGRHDPDGQFRHLEATYPGIVFEVAHSQKAKDLQSLADEYILRSDGDIRVVIGIKLDNKEPHNAMLSVWEARIVPNHAGEDELVAQQVVVNERFRDEKGNLNKSANINLQLQHFATEALSHRALQDPIQISAEKICELLDRAAKRASVRQEKTGQTRSSKPWVRKRPREVTPNEELEDRHEKKFREDERRTEEKMEADDSSYKTGSSFGTE